MAKYRVDADEWYPVYSLDKPRLNEVTGEISDRPQELIELDDEEYADYQAAVAAFNHWQQRLGADDL